MTRGIFEKGLVCPSTPKRTNVTGFFILIHAHFFRDGKNQAKIFFLDRKAICIGLCHVLAALPDNQRAQSLLALAMPSLDCLNIMTQHAQTHSTTATTTTTAGAAGTSHHQQLNLILDRISAEIVILTTMARSFTDAFSMNNNDYSSMQSGCRTSDGHAALVGPALDIVKRAWPSIVRVASRYNYNEVSTTFRIAKKKKKKKAEI